MDIATTKGEKKILLQFERFVETDFFKKEVKRIRSLCKLPAIGIETTEEDLKKLSDIFRVPDNFPVKKTSGKEFPLRTLNLESKKITDLLPITNPYLTALVRHYIIFNKFFYEELSGLRGFFHTANVCELDDAQMEFDEYAPSEDPEEFYSSFSVQAYIQMLKNKLWKYPVVIRIHPDASQRDIVEYVKKHWAEIKYYQDQYADRTKDASFKNSKTKVNKNTKERNDFIYKNRNLSSKEIAGLLGKQGIFLDVGHILKIISLEKKKREKK